MGVSRYLYPLFEEAHSWEDLRIRVFRVCGRIFGYDGGDRILGSSWWKSTDHCSVVRCTRLGKIGVVAIFRGIFCDGFLSEIKTQTVETVSDNCCQLVCPCSFAHSFGTEVCPNFLLRHFGYFKIMRFFVKLFAPPIVTLQYHHSNNGINGDDFFHNFQYSGQCSNYLAFP